MQPLFGSVGFCGGPRPVTCGVLLPVLQSVVTAAFAFASALIMGRLRLGRPHELGRGHAPRLLEQPGGRVPGGGVAAGHLGFTGASWIAAAGLYSLLCVRGTRAFDIVGSVVAAAVLMLGACAAAHLASFGGSWLPAPAALLGALVPGVLGILAAVMSIPDRARWAEEEWYVEEEK